MLALYWKGLLLVISRGGFVYELDVVISTFLRELVVLIVFLFGIFFSNIELLDR